MEPEGVYCNTRQVSTTHILGSDRSSSVGTETFRQNYFGFLYFHNNQKLNFLTKIFFVCFGEPFNYAKKFLFAKCVWRVAEINVKKTSLDIVFAKLQFCDLPSNTTAWLGREGSSYRNYREQEQQELGDQKENCFWEHE